MTSEEIAPTTEPGTSTAVTLKLTDGTEVPALFDSTTGAHTVTCDICHRDFVYAHPLQQLPYHRKGCAKTHKKAAKGVTLKLPDGSTFLTSVDASQVHHVICDTCNGDIILTTDANPHRFLEHRKECLPNAKVDTVGDAAEVTLPASQTAGTRRYPHEQPNQHPHKRKRSPDEDLRLPPPKLTMASGSVVTPYDTLGALLLDLNRLLHAPHDDPELNFMGECPVIWEITGADAVQTDALHATLDVEETVRAAAWAVIRHTVLAFDIHSLTIQTTQRSALAQTQSAAIWMGAPSSDPLLLPKATAAPMSCDHCEHLLTIGVRPRNAVGVQPEEYRILISLRHAPA